MKMSLPRHGVLAMRVQECIRSAKKSRSVGFIYYNGITQEVQGGLKASRTKGLCYNSVRKTWILIRTRKQPISSEKN